MMLAGLVIAVGLLSLAITRWLIRTDSLLKIVDTPNERSLHVTPTPRTGGIAICLSLFIGWMIYAAVMHMGSFPINILIGSIIIALVAIFDDYYNLGAGFRLLVQICAVSVLIYFDFVIQGDILPGINFTASNVVVTILTMLFSLWFVNLYNFMDGMDGFAGGMTVIGFGTLAILGWQHGDILFAGSALTVSAAAAGFLWFNFPPARIFMGDSGSTTLGFLVAAFAIWASRRGIAGIWVTLVIFSPFVVDATLTLLRRALRGDPVWKAHRTHYYQRLVQLGWGHRRTVLVEYAVMLSCAVTALVINSIDERIQWFALSALAAGYLFSAIAIHRVEINRNARIQN